MEPKVQNPALNVQSPSEAEPDSLSFVEMQWRKFLEFKASNPAFKKYIATWNLRAEVAIKISTLQTQFEGLSQELEDLKARLSEEEKELL